MRITVIFIFIIVIITSLRAQNEFKFGPKLGFNIGAPVPIGNIPKGAKGTLIIGQNLGLFFNYSISRHFSVQIEKLFSRKAAKFSLPLDSMPYTDHITHPVYPDIVFDIETFFNGMAEGEIDNYYYEIPVMINYHFKNPKWSVCLGAFFSFLTKTKTNAHAIGTAGYDPALKNEYIDFAENTRNYDLGVIAGGQYITNSKLGFNLRVTYGLESILVDSYTKFNYSLNNTFVQFAAFYAISTQK